MKKKSAYVIRHVAFEDLGCLDQILNRHNYVMKYFEAGYDDLNIISKDDPELLIVLGGPIGVYDHNDYPFLEIEKSILRSRIAHEKPTLGICLGAQLIASALGAEVYSGGKKEIGWSGLRLTDVGRGNYFRFLDGNETTVLHWHGDTFHLPKEAVLQASTDVYPNQAFTVGKSILALQFHPEVTQRGFEKWLIGHASEISSAKISVAELRKATQTNAETLYRQAQLFFDSWLKTLGN